MKQLLTVQASTLFFLLHGARDPPGSHDAYDPVLTRSSRSHRCRLIAVIMFTMPARHRERYSGTPHKVSTITLEFCSRAAGIRVHVALETLSTMSRNSQQAEHAYERFVANWKTRGTKSKARIDMKPSG